ncbi:hypothetical protein BDR03DRAFT_959011 [Suillus americanus]|nr:hypothetical protein BDR03DRAFT_959011 [Suillus americanus]
MSHLPLVLLVNCARGRIVFWSTHASYKDTLTSHCAMVPMLLLGQVQIEDPV